jgi:hypothetical protein
MTTIEEWIKLTDSKANATDLHIHKDHLGKLSLDEITGWIIMEEHAKDYYNYYPIKTTANGIRFACVYVNINKKSEHYGKLFRLTSHIGGHIDFDAEDYKPYIEELARKYE